MPMSQAMELMTSRSTVECYSPEAITERLPRALGGPVELDPASCATANRTVRAARYYTKDDDGYMRDWTSPRLYLNPPFDDTPRWVKRWAAAYAAGEVGATVLLVNSAPGYEWWHDLIDRAPVVLLRRRLSFLREDGTPYPDHHKKGQTVAYLGPDLRAFLAAFGALGRALLPLPHLAELVGRLETLEAALLDARAALPAKGADRAYGALSRAVDIAGLAAWSATKHAGGMEPLWTPQEVDRAAA